MDPDQQSDQGLHSLPFQFVVTCTWNSFILCRVRNKVFNSFLFGINHRKDASIQFYGFEAV